MPPLLALIITLGFIGYLFNRDSRQGVGVSGALWLPTIWVVIIGSRFLSQWLDTFGLSVGGGSLEDGSPIDAVVFFGLIAGGVNILRKRRVSLRSLIQQNQWLTIFLAYCFVAIVWSDFPFVAFKRWIKILGHPIMALIIMTERDVSQAVTTVMRRSAYILMPLSVIFIKYLPEFGRGFDGWTGAATNTGVTLNKNILGADCLVLGVVFIWSLYRLWNNPKSASRRNEIVINVTFLIMILWLLWMADSKTSLMSLIAGVVTMAILSLRIVNKRNFGTYVLVALLIASLAELAFGIYAGTLQLLGRNATLTDRTDIWREVLNIDINPVLGAGFESFWLGERYKKLGEIFPFQPNQAHNGYLETYLNLGWIGVFILIGLILSTYRKARREILRDFRFGQLRIGFLFAFLLYNYTEAALKALHVVWFTFYIIALDCRRSRGGSVSMDSMRDVHPRGSSVAVG
ncbi:MAG: O-antigen ligase family protein [Chthoniobacteraceae bacterium]